MNSSIAMTKVLDTLVGPLESPLPVKNGVNYLLTSTHDHLIKMSAAPLVEENIQWISTFFGMMPAKNVQHRNALLKSFSEEENFSSSKMFFNNIGNVFSEYGDWIKSGQHLKAENRSLGKYDPRFDCERAINHFITPYPCPSREVVKNYGNDAIYLLQNVFESRNGSPVAMMLKAFKSNEGLDIPLHGENPQKFRISLRDTFR
jgi:hypothetical protein